MSSVLRQLSALFVGLILLILGNTLLGIAVPLQMEDAGYATGTSGLIMSVYFLGWGFGALYGRDLILSVGHIRAFAVFATLFSAAVVLHPLVFEPFTWAALRLIAGACIAGLFMVIESWLNERTPAELRGRILGVYTTLTYLAAATGQPLINLFEVGNVEPYLVATLMLSLSLIPVVMTRIPAPELPKTKPMSLRELSQFSPLAVVGSMTSGIIMGCFYSLAAIYARNKGFSVFEVSLFLSAQIVGGLLSLYPIGLITDRFDRRKVLLVILAASTICCFLIFNQGLFAPGVWPLVGLTLLMGASIASIYPVAITQAYDYLEPEQYVSAATGLLLAFAAGSFLGPVSTSFLMQWTRPEALFFVMGTSSLGLMLFTLYRMNAREALTVEEQETVLPLPNRTTPQLLELDPRTDENWADRDTDEGGET